MIAVKPMSAFHKLADTQPGSRLFKPAPADRWLSSVLFS
jgi:hypothetical protein